MSSTVTWMTCEVGTIYYILSRIKDQARTEYSKNGTARRQKSRCAFSELAHVYHSFWFGTFIFYKSSKLESCLYWEVVVDGAVYVDGMQDLKN